MEQRGIALLLVLCVLLLMSVMVTISSDYWVEMYYLTEKEKKEKENKWLLLAAERFFLNDMIKTVSNDNFMINKSANIIINRKNIDVALIEVGNCFNINTLQYSLSKENAKNKAYPWWVLKNILQLENRPSSYLNEIIMDSAFFFKTNHKSDHDDIELIFKIKQELLVDDFVESILKIDEFFFNTSPIFCSRNDDKLLINVNMLEARHTKLIQAIFLHVLNEVDITKIILSKPENGWSSVTHFFESIMNDTTIDIDDVLKIINLEMLNFSHDEYHFLSNFKVSDKYISHQLKSHFYIKNKKITLLDRRFSIGEYPIK